MEDNNKIRLFIIDEDSAYTESLKHTLEEKLGEDVSVKVFNNGEAMVQNLQNVDKKPHLVLLDYSKNKMPIHGREEHTLDHIMRISPFTGIIMLSAKKYKDRALKAIGYGAYDYIEKDQFAIGHIINSVKMCLHPSKV